VEQKKTKNFFLAPRTPRFNEEERKLSGETQTRSKLEIEHKKKRSESHKTSWSGACEKGRKAGGDWKLLPNSFVIFIYILSLRHPSSQPASQPARVCRDLKLHNGTENP
jgi:hypothetical protein